MAPVRRLRVPHRVLLAGKVWRVYQEPPPPRGPGRLPTMGEDGLYGVTYPGRREIYLGAMPKGLTRDVVLVHELLHACFAKRTPLCSDKLEERIVDALAPRVFELLGQLRWERPEGVRKAARKPKTYAKVKCPACGQTVAKGPSGILARHYRGGAPCLGR